MHSPLKCEYMKQDIGKALRWIHKCLRNYIIFLWICYINLFLFWYQYELYMVLYRTLLYCANSVNTKQKPFIKYSESED